MATKKEATTAEASTLARADAAGMVMFDPLAAVLGEGFQIEETGTEELEGSARIPRYAFNLTSVTGDDGKPREVRKTVFVQTVTGEQKEKLRLQVITDHKSRQWKEQVDGKSVVRCSSWDGITGSYGEERTERPCTSCPDYRWAKNEKGENRRRCGDVHNIVAIDLDTADSVIISAKKTATKPWLDYYAKHFQKARAIRDPKTGLPKKVDLPFLARETHVELRLVTKGGNTWAEPVFTPGPIFPTQEHMQRGMQALIDWRAHQADIASRGDMIDAQAIEADGESSTGKPDTSFDFGENRDPATDGMR